MKDRCTEARVVKVVGLYTRGQQQIDSQSVWFKDKRESRFLEVESDQKQGSAIHVRSEREYVPISEGQEESECTRRCDNYTESLNGGGRKKREKGREMDGLLQASSRTIPWASNETSHLD